MRLLVLAALAAVAVADVSHLPILQYGPPASSYGAPQNSVTEKYFHSVTTPPIGLNLPILEHQDFNSQIGLSNPGFIFSSTAAPFIDSGIPVSTTPAPIIDSGIGVSTTPAPSLDTSVVSSTPAPGVQVGSGSLGTGFSYTTPAPDLSFNVGNIGLQNSFVSSTPTPSVSVTSGSQENLNFDYNPGFNLFSTPAPNILSTPAPSIFSTAAPSISSDFNFAPGNFPNLNLGYNFGLGGFSTPAPITFGRGGLTSVGSNLFNADAALNSASIQGITSGGSLNDAFGISTAGSYQRQPAQVYKHVYFYAAPEEPELPRPRINVIPPSPPRKNVKIIFIKSPAPPAPAPIRIAPPPQDEEKTVIYVLAKRPEEHQDIEFQAPPPAPPARPEVYFIRYKTQQEAEQAISQVQSGHSSSEQHVTADTVSNEGDLINTISKESSVTSEPIVKYVTSTTPAPISLIGGESSITAQPIFNYVSSTTPAPILNYIGGQSGGIYGPGFASNFNLSPQLDESDISQNLISSPLFSTASPIVLSTGDSGLIGSTTPVPLGPHLTYGPPGFKK